VLHHDAPRLNCSTLAGIIVFCIGIAYISQISVNARNNQIAAFNSAVQGWPAASQAFVARGPFTVTLTGAGSVPTNLSTTITPDEVPIEAGAGISVFSPSARAAFTTTLSPFPAPAVPSGNNLVWYTVVVSDGSGAIVGRRVINFAWSNQQPQGDGGCGYGTSTSGGSCQGFFSPAGGLCLTLDQRWGSWDISGGGCNSINLDTALSTMYLATFGPGSQAILINTVSPPRDSQLIYSMAGSASDTFLWSGFSITVRSNLDPYAVFVAQTAGYGTFGEQQAELLRRGEGTGPHRCRPKAQALHSISSQPTALISLLTCVQPPSCWAWARG